MNDIHIYSTSADAIDRILSIGIPAFIGLIMFFINLYAGTEVAALIRATAKKSRKYVDETNDPAILVIDGVGELIVHHPIDNEVFVKLLTRLIDTMSTEGSEPPPDPPREAAPTGG